jgi:tight adherence protein C
MTSTMVLLVLAVVGTAGLTMLLSLIPWFARIGVVERLGPYQPGRRRGQRELLSVASFRDVIAPLARSGGARLARVMGVDEDLAVRLTRVHSDLDVTGFRIRQIGVAVAAMAAGTFVAVAISANVVQSVLLVIGSPLLAFVAVEQRLASASKRWQRRIFLELPVITEQLGMLTSAGWSLGAALNRIADRGAGACAQDLARARARMRHGLSDIDALREWAALADVAELDSLVAILAMNRETTDLGRLLGEEARSMRREAQRELIETIERRTQQVWIPVTVAALLPGVLLMGVPFLEALSLFSK